MPVSTHRRRRLALLLAALLLGLAPGVWGILDGMVPRPLGLNDAGAEFSGADRSGAPLSLSSPVTLDWVRSQGFGVVRLPFRWEQVQPSLTGPLAPEAVESLRGYVREAHRRGLQVILDPHNAARYWYPGPDGAELVGVVGTPPVTYEAFADFWRRMSREFRGQPGIYAYCLMNEPHDIVTRHWEEASQAAVDVIRAEGDGTLILVPGSNFSSAYIWVLCHGRDAWIRDPLDNYAYEAHCYFDGSGNGRYSLPYEEEVRQDPRMRERTTDRLQVFVDWCEFNGVRGFIGEFGCPEDPRWLDHLDRFLALMDRSHMGGTAWAAGEAWPEHYHLLLRPGSPQVEVLRRHSGPWTLAAAGPDAVRGYRIVWRRLYQAVRGLRDGVREWWRGPPT